MKKKRTKPHTPKERQESLPGFGETRSQRCDLTGAAANDEDVQLTGIVRTTVPDKRQSANRAPQLLPETLGQDHRDEDGTRRPGAGRAGHSITSRTEFANLVFELRCGLEDHPGRWPNGSLISFLNALATFAAAGGDDRYRLPEWSDWETFSEILLAAKTYGA